MEIEFEEIDGKRYATWTAQNNPFGMQNAFTWRQFAGFLAGVAVLWIVLWLSSVLVVFGGWSIACVMGLVLATFAVLLAVLFRWSFRERRKKRTASFREWRAREPGPVGVPCSMMLTAAITAFGDSGLLCVDGNRLLFRGPRFQAAFPLEDLKDGAPKPVMRFAYRTPFGKRRATLVVGGPSENGWISKKDAFEEWAAQLGDRPSSCDRSEAVYPPLRYPAVAFEPGFLTRTIPLMLAAYLAVSFAFGVIPMEAVRWSFGRPTGSILEYLGFIAAIYACYGLVVAAGYAIRRWMRGANTKVDRLPSPATR